jgi:segregation and condensation protein A
MSDIEPARRAVAGPRDLAETGDLVLDLDGYEGPIDLLLSLARAQKVDLAGISILALADQYLDFIAAQPRLDLAVAADYLVMAAALAYLKSCLLLPAAPKDEEEPDADELAQTLRHRLALLQAMQEAGRRLMARPRCGLDFFQRGAPEEFGVVAVPRWEVGLYELLAAYGEIEQRRAAPILAIAPSAYHSIDAALRRLARLIGRTMDWRELSSLLPTLAGGGEFRRSAVAATFAAALELVRAGQAELRQELAFGPVWLRRPGSAKAGSARVTGSR